MIRSLLVFTFFFTFPLLAHSQDTTLIIRQANILARATFKGDAKTITIYTYPALVELTGGKEKFQQLITDRMAKLKYQGINKFDGIIGSPGKFLTAGNEIHCLLPEDIFLTTMAGRYKSKSYLLGISKDGGINWTFLDVGNMSPAILHQLLPNFNNDIVIPPPAKPEFLAN